MVPEAYGTDLEYHARPYRLLERQFRLARRRPR
jgi:hypothetical protein